jgi:hypothetical protein
VGVSIYLDSTANRIVTAPFFKGLSHRKPRDLPADPLSPVQVAQSGIHATGMFVVLLTTERL